MAGETSTKLAHLRAPITELNFSEEEIRRYSRHIVLPEVGGIGQKQINRASVLVVAPTVTALATRAGDELHAFALELPAAIA